MSENPKQPKPIRSRPHLGWLKTLGCCAPACFERHSEPHHIRLGSHTGMAMKPGDNLTIPLCRIHHDEIHRGQKEFEEKYRLDVSEIAGALWEMSPANPDSPI